MNELTSPFDYTPEEIAALTRGELHTRHSEWVWAATDPEVKKQRTEAFWVWAHEDNVMRNGPSTPEDISTAKARFPIIMEVTGRERPDGTVERYDPPLQPPTWDADKIYDYDGHGNLLPEDRRPSVRRARERAAEGTHEEGESR